MICCISTLGMAALTLYVLCTEVVGAVNLEWAGWKVKVGRGLCLGRLQVFRKTCWRGEDLCCPVKLGLIWQVGARIGKLRLAYGQWGDVCG